MSIYSIIAALYTLITVLAVQEKCDVFWCALGIFMAVTVLNVLAILLFPKSKRNLVALQIPIELTLNIYLALILINNVLFLIAFNTSIVAFIVVNVVLFLIVVLVLCVFLGVRGIVRKQNEIIDTKSNEWQLLILEFENLKFLFVDLAQDIRSPIEQALDKLLDQLKYSSFGLSVDVSQENDQIRNMANAIGNRLMNLNTTQEIDVPSVISLIEKTKLLVKHREQRIKILQGNV